MASFQTIKIDPQKLETQLRSAIQEDEKYKRENAAKFRAMEQSKSYEEFRDIVKAAHLKPLHKSDMLNPKTMGPAPWNKSAKSCNKRFESATVTPMFEKESYSQIEEFPANSLNCQNFEHYWTSLSDNTEKQILMLNEIATKEDFFKDYELSADMIENILEAILKYLENHNSSEGNESFYFAFKIMNQVSSASRFKLNLQFLSTEGKNVLKTLKMKMAELIKKRPDADYHCNDELQQVLKKYWEDV